MPETSGVTFLKQQKKKTIKLEFYIHRNIFFKKNKIDFFKNKKAERLFNNIEVSKGHLLPIDHYFYEFICNSAISSHLHIIQVCFPDTRIYLSSCDKIIWLPKPKIYTIHYPVTG